MKRLFLAVPLALLWVMTAAVPDAAAYETYSSGGSQGARTGNCATCHGDFFAGTYVSNKDSTPWNTNLMQGHTGFFNDCSACHTGSGSTRSPVFIGSSNGGNGLTPIGCVGCHGREADAGNDSLSPGRGAGLRQHHTNAGVGLCSGCHADASPGNYTPVVESVFPAYYFTPDAAHPSKPVDPCNAAPPPGNENKFGPTGLDNDGDLLDDGADSDCVSNQPPVADANGPYSGTEGVAVSFDGSGSADSDGTIVAYDWDFGDGNTGTGVSPTHAYAAAGPYTVTLTVTDDGTPPLSDSAETTATITAPANIPPTADANGPYTGTVGSPVQFDGSGSSDMPPGTIVAYDWDFGDGGTGTGVSPTHTYAAAGPYTVTLTVTDDGTPPLSDSAETTATISVLLPPVADAGGPYTGTVGIAVTFDGSGSTDSDGTIVAYDWDFGDGGTGSGVSPTHTYTAAGPYTVTLTVTDDDDLTDSNQTTATIDVLPPPAADANGPYNGIVGVPVTFDGTGSSDTPPGTIVSYEWDFGDGGTGSGPTPTHTYASADVFPVTLTVTDDDGLSDSDNTTATITDTCGPPVADPNGPYVGTVGVPVQFDGSGSTDPCGAIVSYEWDFGDGNTGTGVAPTHTYAADNLYSVTLTVTNDEGATDSDNTTATIGDGPMEVDLRVPRSINPGNKGVTPAGFWVDMMDLEIAMVTCGPDMAEPLRLYTRDFNDDGFQDVGAKFITRELGLVCGDEVLICQGTLADGTTFTATSNTFKTVGRECKSGPWAKRGSDHDDDDDDDDDNDGKKG